jgi:hypothetical protein
MEQFKINGEVYRVPNPMVGPVFFLTMAYLGWLLYLFVTVALVNTSAPLFLLMYEAIAYFGCQAYTLWRQWRVVRFASMVDKRRLLLDVL